MIDRAEIEAALERQCADVLQWCEGRSPLPGWGILFSMGFELEQVGMASIPVMSDDRLATLVEMARTNPHAFDGAAYLAAMKVAVNQELPMPLRPFAAQALAGEIKRPSQRGRPLSDDIILKMWQYSLAHFTHVCAKVPLGRNTDSKLDEQPFNACDAVADAFTKCGHRTTYGMMRSLCYDEAYDNLRGIANWMSHFDLSAPGMKEKFHLDTRAQSEKIR